MDFIRGAIRQPVTVAVGVILIVLAGLVALGRIPIQLTPNVEDTMVTVSTVWEGASPQEIEQEIIEKQEEQLQGLENLREMTSAAQLGSGSIRLTFAVGIDKDDALREVGQKLEQVPSYPENVDKPVIVASDAENRDYIAWIVFSTTDPDFDIRTQFDFATDRIEPILERVKGVSEANVLGGREREVQVRIDPVRLAQTHITPTKLVDAIRRTNRNVSAGNLAEGKLDVRLRTLGQYTTLEDVADTIVEMSPNGPILVRDIAEVVSDYKEPRGFVRSRGEPVIAINVQREIGSNVMTVMEGIRERIAEMNRPGGLLEQEARRLGLNGELNLRQVYDQTRYINDALALVRNNIWIGGGLAVLMLLLFLRSVRTVGIIALAIPISVVGAIVAMVAMGRSINVISLAGMAFAVGMVVDNAIVVLENIFRHLEMGKPPARAAYDGTREVWGAVLASTLTTIVVFIPILLVQEEAGQLFRDIALAICAAVALSLIVSVSVIPTASARILASGSGGASGLQSRVLKWIAKPFALAFGWLPRALARLIYVLNGTIVLRVAIVALIVSGAVIGTIKLMPPTDYLPTGNRNLVFGLLIPPPAYNIEQAGELGARVEKTIRPFWEAGMLKDDPQAYEQHVANLPTVPRVNPFTGQVSGSVVPPTLENYFFVGFDGIMFHGGISDDPDRVADVVTLMQHAARPEVLPGVFGFARQVPLFRLGGSSGSAVKIDFVGDNLDRVTAAAGTAFAELRSMGFSDVQPSPGNFNVPAPELQIKPDLDRLSELGMTTEDLGLLVRAAGDGAIIDEYRLDGDSIDLKVISKDTVDQRQITGLTDLPVATPTGHLVPLESIARIQRTTAPTEIHHVGRQRAVTLQLTVTEMPLEQAISDVDAMIADLRQQGQIPPDVQVNYSGSASKLQAVRSALLGDGTFIGTLTSTLMLALIVVYLLMCVLFQSFTQPLVILVSVPLATLGGFLALAAVHLWSAIDIYMPLQKLDVLTMLGFIILIGVVVNNAILIVHQSLNFLHHDADIDAKDAKEICSSAGRDASGRMTPRMAIAEAVRTRVRPIFMSTATSVGGMLPLVLMPGAGSELYRGLGSVVVGGLIVSTIFTLLLVPLLLGLLFDVQEAIKRAASAKRAHRRDAGATVAAAPAPAPSPAPRTGAAPAGSVAAAKDEVIEGTPIAIYAIGDPRADAARRVSAPGIPSAMHRDWGPLADQPSESGGD